MDKKNNDKYSKEIDDIIKSRYKFIDRHYLSIRNEFFTHYDWPDFDTLRHEICLCIMFGLCQSAITLTNHLLESVLKKSLIYISGKDVNQSEKDVEGNAITSLEEKYADGIKKYNGLNLYDTINLSRKLELITENQMKVLHAHRENFRNAFGHGDIKKIFGKSTVPIKTFKVEDEGIIQDESRDVEIANFMVGQCLVQAKLSQDLAGPYFKDIDNLVRLLFKKLFEDDKKD